eukprot:219816_1
MATKETDNSEADSNSLLTLKKQHEELKQMNKRLQAKIKQLTNQVVELKSDNQTKDEMVSSLEKELESVLKLSSLKRPPKSVLKPPKTLLQNAKPSPNKKQSVVIPSEEKKEEPKPKPRGVIGIIGAAQMGVQLATLLSLKGYKVIVVDRQKALLDKASNINKSICASYLQQHLASKKDIDNAQIIYCELLRDLSKYSSSIQFVIDTAHDAYKKQVLQEVAKYMNKQCVIITHTTKKSITELSSYIGKVTPHLQGNLIGINLLYFELSLQNNKCIEIMPSWNTSNDIVERCKQLVRKDLDRDCVVLQDSCCFVSNRLYAVYLNEAFHVLSSKISDAAQMDKIQRFAMANMGNMGPFAMADRIGLDVIVNILDELYREYGLQRYVPHPMLKQYIRCGKWGRKSGVGVYSYKKQKKVNKTQKSGK